MYWQRQLSLALRVLAFAWGALLVRRTRDPRTALLLPLLGWVVCHEARYLFAPGPCDANLPTSVILVPTLAALGGTLVQAYREDRARA